MDARRESEPTPMKNGTTVERKSERELVVTRTSTARRASCSRPGPSPSCSSSGGRRSRWACSCVPAKWMFVSGAGTVWCSATSLTPCEFFGRYIEVTPHSRLVWTNEEGGDGGPVTTVTFEEKGGKTLLVMHELYPSKEASTRPAPGRRMRWARRSSSWTSFSSPWARAWDGRPRQAAS